MAVIQFIFGLWRAIQNAWKIYPCALPQDQWLCIYYNLDEKYAWYFSNYTETVCWDKPFGKTGKDRVLDSIRCNSIHCNTVVNETQVRRVYCGERGKLQASI